MKKGIILSLVTMMISGMSIFANGIFVAKTDPLIFAIIRNSVVAIILTGLLLGVGKISALKALTKKEWGLLLAIGAIGGGIPFAMFFTGLGQIGAVSSNIIQKTLFIWVALLAVPILKERLSKIQLVGYGSFLVAMVIAGNTWKVFSQSGAWLILGATILWAVENVIAKVALKTIPASVVAWGRMTFGLPCLVLAALLVGKGAGLFLPAAYAPQPIIVSSIFLTLYVLSWYTALSWAPVTVVSAVLVAAPVVTALLAGTMLQKSVPNMQLVNLLFISLGTGLVIWPTSSSKTTTSPDV